VANQTAWLLGTLKPGEQRAVDISYKATAPGKICNESVALADDNLQAKNEFCTDFKGASALLFRMEDTRDPVAVGEDTSYTIVVENQGSLPATNIQIRTFVPPEMDVVEVKGPVKFNVGAGPVAGQMVVFEPMLELPVGKTARYDVFVKARKPGDVRFRAELTADQLKVGGPVIEEESTMIFTAESFLHQPFSWRRALPTGLRR
jgi:uncharacterized repeat protein (TIGR01451 family)